MGVAGAESDFILHKADKLLHFAVHVFHAFPHRQDDGNAGDIYAQVSSQVENELQPLQIFFRIKARVAVGARGLEQAFTLVKTQRLRMDAVHLRYGGDHVSALGFAFSRHKRFLRRDAALPRLTVYAT